MAYRGYWEYRPNALTTPNLRYNQCLSARRFGLNIPVVEHHPDGNEAAPYNSSCRRRHPTIWTGASVAVMSNQRLMVNNKQQLLCTLLHELNEMLIVTYTPHLKQQCPLGA